LTCCRIVDAAGHQQHATEIEIDIVVTAVVASASAVARGVDQAVDDL